MCSCKMGPFVQNEMPAITRNSLSMCTPIFVKNESLPTTAQEGGTSSSQLGSNSCSATSFQKETEWSRCCNIECLTCLALTSIVVGLPVAIVIALWNLPLLSTRRDTRQQHYILLAFGIPFTLVLTISFGYALFRLWVRFTHGPSHTRHLRTRNSLKRFSRRLGGFPNRLHRGPRPHSSYTKRNERLNFSDFDKQSDDDQAESVEPKLYSLVNEVMSKQNHPIFLNEFDAKHDSILCPPIPDPPTFYNDRYCPSTPRSPPSPLIGTNGLCASHQIFPELSVL